MGSVGNRSKLGRAGTCLLSVVALVAVGRGGLAQEILRDASKPADAPTKAALFRTPYAFYTPAWELAGGYIVVGNGYLQDQFGFFASAAVSTNLTTNLILGGHSALVPGTERMFVDGFLTVGHYTNQRAYLDGNPLFPDERAGSNESDPEDFIEDVANEIWIEVPFRYVLPIGAGDDGAVETYLLDKGLLVSPGTGGTTWNPFGGGRTFVGVQPFFRRQEYQDAPSSGLIATNGLSAFVEYDNTDFPRNPSGGSRTRVGVQRDFGILDSTSAWTVVNAHYSKFIDFGATDHLRQQVLALGAWTADTPSWSVDENGESQNAPPYFMGATLGGLRRLRAFPTYRFNDRAAVHYWAEYRVIPDWQPIRKVRVKPVEFSWLQIAAFGELGRVAPEWALDTLHEDMKWDVGLSFRVMANKAIFRVDFAIGAEGGTLLVDIGQPF